MSLLAQPVRPAPGTEAPRLTVVTPIYNAMGFLPGLLRDIESQTIAPALEWIGVETASDTSAHGYVLEHPPRVGSWRYVTTSERRHPGIAVSFAARLAASDILAIWNVDDRRHPEALAVLGDALRAQPEDVALVYARCLVGTRANETYCEAEARGTYAELLCPPFDPVLFWQGCLVGPLPVYRRGVHDVVGDFCEDLTAADYDFWLRLLHAGYRFARVDRLLGLYFNNPTGVDNSNTAESIQNAARLRREWPRR